MSDSKSGDTTSENPSRTPLALTPSDTSSGAQSLGLNQTIKFDELGPMVVNSDGTLSRIANWKNMTPQEQERTLRVLGTRNRLRIENEKKKLQEHSIPTVGGDKPAE